MYLYNTQMKFTFLINLLLLLNTSAFGSYKTLYEIEGKVLDYSTRQPVPYAKIFNTTIDKGTISNLDGYFRIPISSVEDVLFVSFMGYKKIQLQLRTDRRYYVIYLQQEDRVLSEVVVGPQDNDYLYDLVAKSRKNQSKKHAVSKAYYELKSFHDSTQIELVEGFYNINVKGCDIEGIDLKAGRLAIQQYAGRYFASLESSRAITQLKTFDKNFYFPISPIEVKKKELKQQFKLRLIAKYVNEQRDSIYHLSFDPKEARGLYYHGELWINKTNETVQKINFLCDSCLKYPFLPIFPSDSIQNVQFNITKTFTEIEGEMYFNHIDFFYVIDYKSRIGAAHQREYKIVTNAILYAYDFENKFDIITPDQLPENASDYRKYNATPYNSFFWTYNDEFRLKDETHSNEAFFQTPNAHTNVTVFKKLPDQKTGFFEHPFIQWSTNRILFREFLSDTLPTVQSGVIYNNYNLKVDYYLDFNTYQDSTHLLSAVLFNPFESFYHLPIDKETQCFINIYFDLCEIVRRKMEKEIRLEPLALSRIKYIYKTYQTQLEKEMNSFFKAVDRGTNRIELEKYNAFVYNELDIDNVALFQLYE